MKIFSEPTQQKKLSLAMGYFDGVHLGHQKVIKKAVELAKSNGTKSAVITFKDHPCCFFYGVCPKYILTRKERQEKIAELGVDYLYEFDFAKIANLSAQEYLKDIIIKNFSPIGISTGFNHHFGAGKTGSPEFLEKMSHVYNYIYNKTEAEKLNGETISSTKIRQLLSNGQIETANKMLGYKFQLEGKVITGQQLGRKIGFRTANVLYPNELIDLPFGAYATIITYQNKTYKGVTNFGIRPTVSTKEQCTVETHILNFDKDIYNENIKIEFIKMLRAEKKFNSIEELKKQIQKDINNSISI